VIAKIEHHGYGDFNLKFVPTDGSTATTTGVAAGAAAGVAIGSVIPVLGTIIGGVVGAGIGGAIGDSIAGWKPGDYTGQFSTWAFKQIKEGGENCLPPGKYRLEVESKNRWTCDFIQPALGQSSGTFDDRNNGDAGFRFWGPVMSSSQPVLATIRHNGVEDFFCVAYSVDGTHQWIFQEEGQFHISEQQTEIKSGKEYIIYVSADGAWTLNFEEAIQDHATSQALDEDERGEAFFITTFLMFGKIAKTDLHVSKDEINAIEAFMVELKFDHDTRKMALDIFNEGKTTEVPFKEIASKFAQYVEDIKLRQYILAWLIKIAAADGVLQATEEQSLNDVATVFGLPPDFVTQALEEEGIPSDIGKYYETLGCDPSVSDDELKRHYHELSLQYHPDRISSKDLAPGFHKFATEKFQEIQNAYEIITEHRKMVNNFRVKK